MSELTSRGHMQVIPDYDEPFYGLSAERKEWLLKQFEAARPKIEACAGKGMIVGTAGDLDSGDSLAVWYDGAAYARANGFIPANQPALNEFGDEIKVPDV